MPSNNTVSVGPYKIAASPGQPLPFEKHPHLFVLSNLACWLLWGLYLLIQAVFIISLKNFSLITTACLCAGLLAETWLLLVDFNMTLGAFKAVLQQRKGGTRSYYRLLGSMVPHVDIFVTCCKEPLDVIMNTVRGAATQDYPISRFNVVVLDDGHDDDLREAIDGLNRSNEALARVYYRTRKVKPGTRSYFKAGNLNHGIEETKKLTNGELIASIDADIIVASDWLRRMVPHLLIDEKLGLGVCPQYYYNASVGDLLAQQAECVVWNTIFAPIHDHLGNASCNGTGFVVRRKALEDIGGWPLAEVGEDRVCSDMLSKRGWKIAYVRENMQHGITPESFQSRVKQRLRWQIDAMFVGYRHANNFEESATFFAKVLFVLFACKNLPALRTLVSLIVLPMAVLMIMLQSASNTSAVVFLADDVLYDISNLVLMLAFITGKFCEWSVYHHMGMTHISNIQSLELWTTPYCVIRSFIHIFAHTSESSTFFVTGSFVSPTNERSKHKRAPIFQRLSAYGLPMHITYVAVSAIILWCSIWQLHKIPWLWFASSEPLSQLSNTIKGSPSLILPGHVLRLTICIWRMSVPVWYMVFPPTQLEWQNYLVSDKRGVLMPQNPMPKYLIAGGEACKTGYARLWRDALEVLVLVLCLGSR